MWKLWFNTAEFMLVVCHYDVVIELKANRTKCSRGVNIIFETTPLLLYPGPALVPSVPEPVARLAPVNGLLIWNST